MSLTLGLPTRPFRGLRNTDRHGSGTFGASRDGGVRFHLGRDYIALPGDTVHSPCDGKVTHIGKAYADADYGSLRIAGKGCEVRMLYVEPSVVVGQRVKMGEEIGAVQDIAARYPGITPHVHVEVWVASDPTLYIQVPN
jgi:murein DD-endopeptidase MepM/ murein hydrolase activator NlpD